MGRVFSSMKRELMNYNVENRAHKVLSRDKLPPAPQYKSVTEDMERMRAQGLTVENLSEKHDLLNKNLKNIHVKSTGPANHWYRRRRKIGVRRRKKHPDSLAAVPPSLDRFSDHTGNDGGFLEPISVPQGKITLKNFLEMLSLYQQDKIKYRPEVLATLYNLDLKFTETAVDRYQILKLHVPNNFESKVKDTRVRLEIKKTLANIRTLTVGQPTPSHKQIADPKEILK